MLMEEETEKVMIVVGDLEDSGSRMVSQAYQNGKNPPSYMGEKKQPSLSLTSKPTPSNQII